MGKWAKLPEWVQWILCWPIILTFTIVVGLLATMVTAVALDRIFIPKTVADVLHPALVTLVMGPVLNFFIYHFVPRKRSLVTGFIVVVSTFLGVMSVIRWYFEITGDLVPMPTLLQDVFQTSAAVGVSWYWFFYFKNNYPDHLYSSRI